MTTAWWIGPLVIAASIVATIEGLVRGADVVAALVGGGILGALLLFVVAAAWALAGLARVLLPARWNDAPSPAAIVGALAVFVAGLVALAGLVAARHRDPAMIAVTVAVLGVALAWSAIAVVVPLLNALAVRLRARDVQPNARLARVHRPAAIAGVVWAIAAMVQLSLPDPPRLRGSIAPATSRIWIALTDPDGDGTGLVGRRAR